ncbi:MAG TPA: aconitate hydratase AcnA [Thermomicrobiales bacterium]|nr:aconitate hydratase AcnA [Thermomicrobiales bacterium]
MESRNAADRFGARRPLAGAAGSVVYYSLDALAGEEGVNLATLPYTVKVLLENLLRLQNGTTITAEDVLGLARWSPDQRRPRVISFLPARVLLQDFTGVPAVVDLAAMRSAMARLGGDPARINPLVPADLVIDHSVQADLFGSALAFARNVELEYERNRERYALLRWAQHAFADFSVVPPGTGICHQVNLEYLGKVVQTRADGAETVALPDTLVGTDSHTTMINGLGVLGWGVGGIEAEAVLLGQPMEMLTPQVVGFRFTGQLPEGATATDLVLTVTQILRQHNVVGKFVEFTGAGLSQLGLADRATLANMAPEYGATCGFFPVDEETLRYLRLTGRDEALVRLVETYCKAQGLFRTDDAPEPEFTSLLELDLATVEPSLAGPERPQDRVPLPAVHDNFQGVVTKLAARPGAQVATKPAEIQIDHTRAPLGNGSVVIAAITSCTNTSNPTVMVGAGLLAKKAVEKGLSVPPTVKTSLAPGSKVVTDYFDKAGLTPYLEQLGFYLVGYGCTTCIGNSGPLPDPVAGAIESQHLATVAVLSGNRNFAGRIHPQVRAQYLASPPLVVAYALAGTVDKDLTSEPLGTGEDGQPVYLRDIWPTLAEIKETIAASLTPDLFRQQYAHVFEGDDRWKLLPVPEGDLYAWDTYSTYVQEPPYFADMSPEPPAPADVAGARVLALLGDSITTDHISPAGSIARDGTAGQYLIHNDVLPRDFNSFGSRRGNHEVMVRGTFANVRLRNQLTPDQEGDWTIHQPDGAVMRIFDAATRYAEEGVPLCVIAGREYGTGSSRDWAAKGTLLLGVKFVLAESFERIHRSNLVGMGVLPLQFQPGESAASLGLDGHETFDVRGIDSLAPGQDVEVRARRDDGSETTFTARVRLDTPTDVEYYRHGGILPYVLRQLLRGRASA